MRIGIGYDSHRFTDGNEVMIGGVAVPHNRGVLAHSDGDVLLHALGDALLGALSLGDIGGHFPDTDDAFLNAESSTLINQIMQKVFAHQYRVVNIDSVVICELPKLKPYIAGMCEHIASLLNVEPNTVSVKATTNEAMGFIGRQEGLAAKVVVLLESMSV